MKQRIITTGKHRMLFMNSTVILPINKRKEGEEKCMTQEEIPLQAMEIARKRMLIGEGVLATSKVFCL